MSSSHAKQPVRTLVTGASGFTGRYLVENLAGRGHTVIETFAGHDEPETATRLRLDITSPENCRHVMETVRPDYIVHLAAISFVGHDDPLDFYRVNVIGTLNLLEACAATGHTPRKVLIASSANVYGNVTSDAIDESFPLTPVNHYAASKAAMETMVHTWFERLPILIARPFNYTGRGQASNFLVPKIVEHFARREPSIELGNLDVARDFSDVRYVARAYEALLTSDAAGETVNVCTGTPYTLREILSAASDMTGHKLQVHVNPAFVRQTDVKVLAGSPAKLRSLVPEVQAIPFMDTLRWMLAA
ncbi:GDP-mannose 4,6-dehydratase [Paraburkholderia sp. SIMBA_055]|jgi:nucleoside-diphosphate-sugar epimerase|uniref:NAD-dependent epimerase/dehydratase n=1 Tax=Paraburkholderia graminis (strain ATCC 700544 / DSM 17151 / LMG 18924 / NCIMB 13744 / C4D1M) TaxID=396598 RepID=B1FXM8_PARG4|nr:MULTISPECIES: GDP-mannose 4,6-dehydratase [Paraburkholderia]ALE56425.1 GDP-6-deoxy-D-lyxo-4-hexulose reductase [Burkholderia sp. HB1]AXF07050.1 GDP-mannose 4,6 dehydratase [Paraburkholderia graminis]EDT11571.1 NAD-dependent epimerase/dehydratase [Paraburkholderia graminis C4D1M]PTR02496.1 nucleoside-diphosphate-sugar epimerase [Paraburkholderia sp. GV072]PUB06973.1 nucleoside-diphosphate-sugar epimerase [Paraburkholderia sp. GV068]